MCIHCEPSKLYFNACIVFFKFLVEEFHLIINEVLIVEGLLQVLIDGVEIGMEDFDNVVQLTTESGV